MEREPRDPRAAPLRSRPRRRIAKRAARRKAQEALYHPRPAKSIANSRLAKPKETPENRTTLRAARAFWYHPKLGGFSPFILPEDGMFTPPSREDWVLVLENNCAGVQ